MKHVFFIKGDYKDNSVRVSYFEKDAIKNVKHIQANNETGEIETILKEQKYDKHLFCQRLEWELQEEELDSYIEEVRVYWEERINS
jgi:hypothetical protein